MARIQTSGLITDISGKVRGSVFQRSQSGLILRSQPGIRRPYSGLQVFNKIGITEIMNAWTTLTQSQRNQWSVYATYRSIPQKKNPTRLINGHQIFIRENKFRYSMHDHGAIFTPYIHTTPILLPPPNAAMVNSITLSGVALLIDHSPTVNQVTQAITFEVSRPITESVQSSYTKRQLVKAFTTSGTVQNIGAAYEVAYGRLPIVGEWLSISAIFYDSTPATFTKSPPQLIEVI